MLFRTPRWVIAAALCLAWPALAPAEPYAIKEADTAPPKALGKAFADLLSPKSVQFLDKGDVVAEVWFRKEVPAAATPQQVKAGLTYEQIPETTFLAVARFDKQVIDFRKQKIKPGVYTLRLGVQPMDGDHMGTAPSPYFCLATPAAVDKNPAPMKEAKELQDLSTKATAGSHPGVFFLATDLKDPGTSPKLVSQEEGRWVVVQRLDATAKGAKGALILGLTLVGVSPAA
jgi:hypothetical protein